MQDFNWLFLQCGIATLTLAFTQWRFLMEAKGSFSSIFRLICCHFNKKTFSSKALVFLLSALWEVHYYFSTFSMYVLSTVVFDLAFNVLYFIYTQYVSQPCSDWSTLIDSQSLRSQSPVSSGLVRRGEKKLSTRKKYVLAANVSTKPQRLFCWPHVHWMDKLAKISTDSLCCCGGLKCQWELLRHVYWPLRHHLFKKGEWTAHLISVAFLLTELCMQLCVCCLMWLNCSLCLAYPDLAACVKPVYWRRCFIAVVYNISKTDSYAEFVNESLCASYS